MPRKSRMLHKARHPNPTRPKPDTTQAIGDWPGRPPAPVETWKVRRSDRLPRTTGVWMNDVAIELDAETPLYDEGKDQRWMSVEDSKAEEERESIPGHDDLMRQYLAEIGAIKRLTLAEEVALAKKIEQGRGGRRRQPSRRKARVSHESPDDPGTLWTEQLDSNEARAHMIRANLRLVISIAKQFSGHGLALLDLIQEGNLGLMKAVDRFDWRRGCRFGTYASWWIKQAIGRALGDQGRMIRLPAHMADGISRVHRIRGEWMQIYEAEPTVEELSKEARLPKERIEQIDQLAAPPVSLDWLLPDGERTVGDQLPDGAFLSHLDLLMDRERDRVLHHSLSVLTPRERRILHMHFGIGQRRAYTLEEIGRRFRLTRERIRQIELKALKKLRHPGRRQSLEDFATIRPRPE